MIRKAVGFFLVITLASAILLVSVFRNASIKYAFTGPDSPTPAPVSAVKVDYTLTYPGIISPDHALWPLKVLRDKLWILSSLTSLQKAQTNLLIADKRLAASLRLFEKDKADLGYSTLTKSQKYLETAALLEKSAREKGVDTSEFQNKLSLAALKHMEVTEEILSLAPEDAKPHIIKSMSYSQNVYQGTKNLILSSGRVPPENPFE